MKKMLAVILIVLFGSVGLVYGQATKDAETQTQAMKYSSKIDELHIKMANELTQLAQVLRSNPKNAVAFFAGPMSNIENFIKERDNLKLEALKYYHGNLPPDLSKKFEDSEQRTDRAKKAMQDERAKVEMAQAQTSPRPYPTPPPTTRPLPRPTPPTGPVYRVDNLTEHELELVHNLLIEKGFKGLTPTQGTHKWSMDEKQPDYFTAVCGKANGGIVRVEIKNTRYPIKETTVRILK
jgi:hypothetical protein